MSHIARERWEVLDFPGSRDGGLLVAGADMLESTDPTSLEVMARTRESDLDDVDRAAERAGAAFRSAAWRRDSPRRARVLQRYAQALRDDSERLAEILSREQGKTLAEARNELHGSADMVDYYAGLARAVYGRSAVLGERVNGVIVRDPVGVVAVITPWNWPLTLLMRSLAPAMAAGNTCIVKPASLTAAVTVAALELLADDDELPDGVVTCVVGSGATVGDHLVGHRGVNMIAFTGETRTGIHVMHRAAEGLRKVALELGGKSANIVFGDAKLDKALAGAANAVFTSCGQICTAGSRLLVEASVADQFVQRLSEHVAGLVVADPLVDSTSLGPVVSASQQRTIQDFIEIGRKEGTIVATVEPRLDHGYFVAPTVVADLPDDSRLIREEIFGPVLTVQTFEDDEQAVQMANDSEYGLAAGLWTSNLDRAWRVGSALEAGTVWINTYHHFYPEAEVGGYKTSGIGRQQGIEGLHEFTETKHLNFDGAETLW